MYGCAEPLTESSLFLKFPIGYVNKYVIKSVCLLAKDTVEVCECDWQLVLCLKMLFLLLEQGEFIFKYFLKSFG